MRYLLSQSPTTKGLKGRGSFALHLAEDPWRHGLQVLPMGPLPIELSGYPSPTELLPPAEAKDPERVEAALAIRRETEDAIQRNREDAIIAALATALSGPRELVDDLLRTRLRHPYNPSKAAIDVFVSSLFSVHDFKDVERLIGQMRSGSTRTTQFVMKQFSLLQQEVLKDSSANIQDRQDTLIVALNDLVHGASIYKASGFAGITLSPETLALQLQQPTGSELARLNRQLLEEAFPKHIRSTRPAIKTILVRLHKTVFLCDALTLGPTDLKLVRKPTLTTDVNGLTEMDLGLTALQFNSLPDEGVAAVEPVDMESFTQLEQLMALGHLRDIAPRATDLLHQYAALNSADSAYVKKARQVLAVGLLGSDEVSNAVKEDNKEYSEVKTAAEQLGITIVDQYRDPIILARLIALLTALKQLGTTVAQAVKLTIASPDDAVALAARTLLRSKFGDSSWHDLIKPMADKLRTRQRDALVDYLIADSTREDPPRTRPIGNLPRLRDANDLYELYLIDVQTGSCLKTTRLLQATAAAQLFVQRLLLNLDGGVTLTDDKRRLWDPMQLYRAWVANRKVFLYPENWLLPELRDDKTATFRQMESALTEQEPSLEVTRAALMGYLDELSDLSQINVIAMYEDRQMIGEEEEGTLKEERTLHVVGRTPNQPYRYFWRSCAQFGDTTMSWSGWEVLDLDNANDFIMPFVMEGDLHVAWPIFRKTTDVKDKNKLMWEVQIAWTRRTTRGWIKRKLSPETLSVPRLVAISELRSFVFRVRTGEEIYEKNAIKPVEPDLTKQNSLQKYSHEVNIFSPYILLNIRGQIAEHYTQDSKDLYRPIKARVMLTYTWTGFIPSLDIPNITSIFVDTDEYGVFDFKSYYRNQSSPTGIPAANTKPFTLTFLRYESQGNLTPFTTREGQTVAPDGRLYNLWEWDFTLIVESEVAVTRAPNLLEERIIFDCYVADEKIKIKELAPDLTRAC